MIIVLLTTALAVVLVGLGFMTIALGLRAGDEVPRWARIVMWLLGIELGLFGVALIALLVQAWVIFSRAS